MTPSDCLTIVGVSILFVAVIVAVCVSVVTVVNECRKPYKEPISGNPAGRNNPKGKKQMKIYVASSWRNEYQQQVVAELRNAGFEVYDFKHPAEGNVGFHWSDIDKNWQNWTTDQYRAALGHDHAQFGFNRDFDAMKNADACVLVLPCGKSAHLEAGWMKGAGRKVVAFIPPGCKIEPELMYNLLDRVTSDLAEVISMLKEAES